MLYLIIKCGEEVMFLVQLINKQWSGEIYLFEFYLDGTKT